jgi:hypothetical protein
MVNNLTVDGLRAKWSGKDLWRSDGGARGSGRLVARIMQDGVAFCFQYFVPNRGQGFPSDVLGGARIPADKLAYFQTRLAGNIHQAMLKAYGRLEREGDFTRRDLAHRIGENRRKLPSGFLIPEISRWVP